MSLQPVPFGPTRNMTGRPTSKTESARKAPPSRRVFPFTALVGQEEMKLALLLNVVAPSVGGVLIMGERGTGKSTAVRALADLLRPVEVVDGCAYNCDPKRAEDFCDECRARAKDSARLTRRKVPVPVVELPLGATEDRVCGTIDIGRALRDGVRSFEPGLLARANRGFLYIDEVNLLEDHLVDLLLDVSVTGRNKVEREGVSLEHPSRFVLVGSGNPEEGELRPQLLDRFGLFTEVTTAGDVDARVLIVERCEEFARDPEGFLSEAEGAQEALRRRLTRARNLFAAVVVPRDVLRKIAGLCQQLGVEGHRGELTITRASRALAAFEGRRRVSDEDVRRVAAMCLRHRMRRDPLEQASGGARIEEGVKEMFGEADTASTPDERPTQPKTQRPQSPRGGESTGDTGNGRADNSSVKSSAGETRGNDGGKTRDGNGDKSAGETRSAPTEASSLRGDAFELGRGFENRSRTESAPSRRKGGARTSLYSTRGRYAGASPIKSAGGSVAPDATLRAVASRLASHRVDKPSRVVQVGAGDLMYKRFRSRSGTVYIFAVDTSGSMAVNRIGQAKGAITNLLRRSYVSRDRVALVCFRDRDGDILLRPCAAPSRAKRILDALPVGGATPLPAGLLRSLEVARRCVSEGARRVVLMLFTDGRANVPLSQTNYQDKSAARAQVCDEVRKLGAALRQAGVSSVVVDTGNKFTSGGEGRELADALRGRYVQLPSIISGQALAETLSMQS